MGRPVYVPCSKCGKPRLYGGYCAPCSAERSKQWKKDNPEKQKAIRERYESTVRGQRKKKEIQKRANDKRRAERHVNMTPREKRAGLSIAIRKLLTRIAKDIIEDDEYGIPTLFKDKEEDFQQAIRDARELLKQSYHR